MLQMDPFHPPMNEPLEKIAEEDTERELKQEFQEPETFGSLLFTMVGVLFLLVLILLAVLHLV